VFEYCVERKNAVDPQRFVDFYTSKGWMVGKSKMKDWKAAVRNREKGETKENPLNMGCSKKLKAPVGNENMAQYAVAFRKKVSDEQ
jgi:hypothetical protein